MKSVSFNNQAGFTLLEAIVALVILAGAGVALLSWSNTNLHSLYRVQQAQQRQAAMRNALAFVETLNPMRTPSGDKDFSLYRIRWEAELVEPMKTGITTLGGSGSYDVGLYELQVEIVDPEDTLLAQFSVRQVGYEQVRFYNEDMY